MDAGCRGSVAGSLSYSPAAVGLSWWRCAGWAEVVGEAGGWAERADRLAGWPRCRGRLGAAHFGRWGRAVR